VAHRRAGRCLSGAREVKGMANPRFLPLRATLLFSVLWAASSSKRKFQSSEHQPDIQKVGIQAVLDWSAKRVETAAADFETSGYKRYPSPATWDNEVVYFVIVDRFANGDTHNDGVNIPDYQTEQLNSDLPFSVAKWRHGGDLQGIRTRLGYLQQLGVTTLWISPILLNNGGSPWGYYMSDPSMIDPGFGTKELLRELVHEAHQRGIRVVLDIITNMATSEGFEYWAQPGIDKVTSCALSAEDNYWNQSGSVAPDMKNTSSLQWGSQLPPYLQNETFFQRCGAVLHYRPTGISMQDLPTDWRESLAVDVEAGWLWPDCFSSPSNMPDFATMNKAWQELYTNLMQYWLAYADLDGFRLDAVKYVSADYIAYFATHVRTYAKTIGKSNLFLTGEMLSPGGVPFAYLYLGGGPKIVPADAACFAYNKCTDLAGDCCPNSDGIHLACCFKDQAETLSRKVKPIPRKVKDMFEKLKDQAGTLSPAGPGLPTFYPTDAHSFQRSIAQGAKKASEWFSDRKINASLAANLDLFEAQGALANLSWQLIDSQDITRLLQSPQLGNQAWRLQVALTWMYTWLGLPTVYYGLEQGLNGLCVKYTGNGTTETIVEERMPQDARESIESLCEAGEDDALKRQDFFSGGPWVLGSAVPEVQAHASITGEMMNRGAPNWCEEPLLNRDNEVYRLTRALGRIRRSCRILAATAAHEALRDPGALPNVMAYWKLPQDSVAGADGPSAALVVLDYNPTPTPTDNVTFNLPKVGLKVGQKFVDLLNAAHTATVVADAAGGSDYVAIAAGVEPFHFAIFVPEEAAKKDDPGAEWMICAAGAKELPPLPMAEECNASIMWISLLATGITAFLLCFIFVRNKKKSGVFLCIVKRPSPVDVLEYPGPQVTEIEDPKHIFVAAIEHTIPERKVKVSAGGLGKVLDQMLREHPPGRLSLVHPKFAGVDYGELTPFVVLEVTVDNVKECVTVSSCEATDGDIHRVWFLLEHKWFETLISKDAPYPYPQTKLSVLRFFSLWNQAAAQLMIMLKPDVYHCMDYHAAMIPLYCQPHDLVPTIIVLHNADYDGAIETDFVVPVLWRDVPALKRLSLIFNLTPEAIRKYLTFEGRFNMLWGGIACARENQGGHGICTVSGKYAAELKRERTMFKGLPTVLPLDNAIDSAAEDGPKSIAELQTLRVESKRALQEFCELDTDPDAKILIFIGRWVKQKGVDHIALLASSILQKNRDVQFVLAGPPGDPYGNYAQELLRPLMDKFKGRLFVVTRFFMIPKEARAGAHLCLMPSGSEPFGYVDVEFGLLGVPSLGCAIGGLGKMPGVYFRQQNSDSQDMLLAGFSAAVQYALDMDDSVYWEMAFECIPAQFPFSIWRSNLLAIYRTAQLHFKKGKEAEREEPLMLDGELGMNVLMEQKQRYGYGKLSDIRMVDRNKDSGVWIQHKMQRMQVGEGSEFLMQPVSEVRVKELMAFWMAENQETDAETLQSHISLGNQRINERSFATRSLMVPCRPFVRLMGNSCLRIHFFIALGYIVSPVVDERMNYISRSAESLQSHYTWGLVGTSITNLGCVLGAFVWLALSRQVPANLLMAVSLFMTERLCSLTVSAAASDLIWVLIFNFTGGFLSTSRWLFLIWNFNEDFHGGFQVGTRRVAMIESCRQAVSGLLQALGREALGCQSFVLSFIVLLLIIMVLLAPSCYSSYVLPRTNFWQELRDHKVYILLIASLSINGLGTSCWNNVDRWLSINGWGPQEIAIIKVTQAGVLIVCLFAMFFSLHYMSVWGPWAMRDLVCFLPPGSLLYTLAFWELGNLHYRSYLFVAMVTFALIIDTARFAAFFTAILTTLANKWYALTGAFAGFAVMKACEAVSPFVVHLITMPWGMSPIYSGSVENSPETHLPTLQLATLLAAWPLALLSYAVQMMAWKYFNKEVLTYKGHGNLMPDGTKGWAASETAFVSSRVISGLRRMENTGALVEESDVGSSYSTESDNDED